MKDTWESCPEKQEDPLKFTNPFKNYSLCSYQSYFILEKFSTKEVVMDEIRETETVDGGHNSCLDAKIIYGHSGKSFF